MKDTDKQFHPDDVDAKIDHFLQIDDQTEIVDQPGAGLVQEISDLYLEESQVLDRAWKRLSEQVKNTSREMPIALQGDQINKGDSQLKHQAAPGQKKNNVMKRLSAIGLGLVAALILASVILVLNSQRGAHTAHETASATANATATPTVIASGPGHVVSSTPLTKMAGTAKLSPDGKRVAVIQVNTKVVNETTTTTTSKGTTTTNTPTNVPDGETVQIWDTLTGQHRVTATFNFNAAEDIVIAPVWSPTSTFIAIPTSKRVLIINAQTGKINTTYNALAQASTSSTSAQASTSSTSSTVLTSFELPATHDKKQTHDVPHTSASQINGLAWSPDGTSIASTYFVGAQNMGGPASIQIWNASTGQVSASIVTDPNWAVGELSWSSDGKYIAASMSSPASPYYQAIVWDATNHQVVFKHSVSQQVFGSSWQPGTHNLAFTVLPNGAFIDAVMQLWNVDTKQQITSLTGIVIDDMVWSPNGKEIAYVTQNGNGSTASVIIVDVNSGQKLYTYKLTAKASQAVGASLAGWTPDGKYIMTDDEVGKSDPVGANNDNIISSILNLWVA